MNITYKSQKLDQSIRATARFFRTMKYDCIYINEFESPKQLRTAIAKFIEQYNYQRPGQPLNYEAPATIYYQNVLKKAA